MYAPSSLMNGEQILVGINCLVSTENLSEPRGRGCPYLLGEERLPRAGRKEVNAARAACRVH